MTVHIYAMCDPRTNEIRYIGKTSCSLRQRLCGHLDDSKPTRKKVQWINELRAHGLRPEICLIETLVDCMVEEWMEAECFWIASLKFLGAKLTNENRGGGGPITHSEEARKKISEMGKARRASAETRAKMSAAQRGRRHTPESIEKLRKAHVGKTISVEQRLKLRLANLGKKQSAESSHKKRLARLGKKCTPEHKAKTSAALMGHSVSEETRAKMRNRKKWFHIFRRSGVKKTDTVSDLTSNIRFLIELCK